MTGNICINFLLILLLYSNVYGGKINCGVNYNLENWDCDSYDYYFASENVKHTLYCLDYNKNSNSELSVQNAILNVKKVLKINEESEIVAFDAMYTFDFIDKRLNFSCPIRSFIKKELKNFQIPLPAIENLDSVQYKEYGTSRLASPRLLITKVRSANWVQIQH